MFDVGECLVNETWEYGTWADWRGVPSHVFSAAFGAVIAGPGLPGDLQVFQPRFDLDKARQQRAANSQWPCRAPLASLGLKRSARRARRCAGRAARP